ncbi:MAG TPA: hypothetical protein VGG39_37795 [Polyangiaceae bacterium]|jgi:hypothetical protein
MSAPTAGAWRFEQLGGDKKTLTLGGYSAPFGRPRQKPVVRDKVSIREKTIRYPGSSGPPTRHIFGDDYEPWELSGRFMDREGGAGYALQKTQEVIAFVRDKQAVRITWGDILQYTGFIKSFDPGREGPGDVEWKMVVLVDDDTQSAPQGPSPSRPSPADSLAAIQAALATTLSAPTMPNLNPNILDALSSLVGAVSGAIGAIANVANQMQSFETALAGDIQRLRAGIGQLRTALLTLQGVVLSARNDAIGIGRSFGTDASSGGLFASIDVETSSALAAAASMDNQAAIAQRGQAATRVTAKGGDTWESLSIRAYGAPDKADTLRQANGVRLAAPPVAGTSYVVPKS